MNWSRKMTTWDLKTVIKLFSKETMENKQCAECGIDLHGRESYPKDYEDLKCSLVCVPCIMISNIESELKDLRDMFKSIRTQNSIDNKKPS